MLQNDRLFLIHSNKQYLSRLVQPRLFGVREISFGKILQPIGRVSFSLGFPPNDPKLSQ